MSLSPQEKAIIAGTPKGKRNSGIAGELGITAEPAKLRGTEIYHKLGVGDRLELAICLQTHPSEAL